MSINNSPTLQQTALLPAKYPCSKQQPLLAAESQSGESITAIAPAQADASLPIGFPKPPAHLSIALERFQMWAHDWRKYNGERVASAILAGRLVEFLSACRTHEKSKELYCESETWLDSAKTQLDAAFKRLVDDNNLVKSATTKSSISSAWAQHQLDMSTNMFTFAIKHMEWVHKYVEKTRNTVKDDKAKLDAAAKAVDELVFPPLPVPYQRQLVKCPIEPLASKGDSISHMCLKYPEKHPLDTNMNAYPAHTGNTEQKLHNSSLIPKTQTLKRVCDNNGEDIKIAKRPRTRQQAKLICNSNIPINMLTDWQQISSKVVLGKILGSGRSGTVYSGIVNRRTVAVKVSKANADAVILNELHNEVNVYQHLANLQGDVIPRLYGHGLLEVDGTLRAALILEEINDWAGKTYPHEDRAEQLSLSVRQSAMNALDKIHACGVIHGDFRMNNVLFERTDSSDLPLKVRFVDLAFAEIGARKCALQLDHAGWGRVLNLPGF